MHMGLDAGVGVLAKQTNPTGKGRHKIESAGNQ